MASSPYRAIRIEPSAARLRPAQRLYGRRPRLPGRLSPFAPTSSPRDSPRRASRYPRLAERRHPCHGRAYRPRLELRHRVEESLSQRDGEQSEDDDSRCSRHSPAEACLWRTDRDFHPLLALETRRLPDEAPVLEGAQMRGHRSQVMAFRSPVDERGQDGRG